MTLQELGRASGVSVGYLSQLERDNATPTLGTLAQIADALSVSIDFFISKPHAANAITIAGERTEFSVGGSSIVYEQLNTEFPGREMSSFILNVPDGFRSESMSHAGEEMIFILEGSIVQHLDGEEFRMKVGDSLHYRGNRVHGWYNDSGAPAKILWVGTLELFRGKIPLAESPKRGAMQAQET